MSEIFSLSEVKRAVEKFLSLKDDLDIFVQQTADILQSIRGKKRVSVERYEFDNEYTKNELVVICEYHDYDEYESLIFPVKYLYSSELEIKANEEEIKRKREEENLKKVKENLEKEKENRRKRYEELKKEFEP